MNDDLYSGVVDILEGDFQRYIVEMEGDHGPEIRELSEEDAEFFELESGMEVEVKLHDNNVTCSVVRVLTDDQLF